MLVATGMMKPIEVQSALFGEGSVGVAGAGKVVKLRVL